MEQLDLNALSGPNVGMGRYVVHPIGCADSLWVQFCQLSILLD